MFYWSFFHGLDAGWNYFKLKVSWINKINVQYYSSFNYQSHSSHKCYHLPIRVLSIFTFTPATSTPGFSYRSYSRFLQFPFAMLPIPTIKLLSILLPIYEFIFFVSVANVLLPVYQYP